MNDKDVTDNESGAATDAAAATVEELSEQQVAELKEKAAKAQHYYEQLLRTTADLENYKKRAARERQDAIKFANESLLQTLIPILDNFEMALSAANTPNASAQSIQAGISMIQQQLKSAMAN